MTWSVFSVILILATLNPEKLAAEGNVQAWQPWMPPKAASGSTLAPLNIHGPRTAHLKRNSVPGPPGTRTGFAGSQFDVVKHAAVPRKARPDSKDHGL